MPQVLGVSGRQRRTAQRNQRGREKRFDSKPVCTAIRRRSEALGEIFEPALLGPISGRWACKRRHAAAVRPSAW